MTDDIKCPPGQKEHMGMFYEPKVKCLRCKTEYECGPNDDFPGHTFHIPQECGFPYTGKINICNLCIVEALLRN